MREGELEGKRTERNNIEKVNINAIVKHTAFMSAHYEHKTTRIGNICKYIQDSHYAELSMKPYL